MKILLISCSLKKMNRSRILACRAQEELDAAGAETCFVDLSDLDLPFCDAGDAFSNEQVQQLTERVQEAHGIVLAGPVYNYAANAACKNMIELTGRAWEDKVVGFLCAAGGQSSYMSVMGLANSLMLDFRCLIVPRFVYATGAAFQGKEIADLDVAARIRKLADAVVRLTAAVAVPSED